MLSYFFSKQGLGVEISTKYLRFVHITKRKHKHTISNFGRIAIPKDVFVEGELRKPSVLASLMQSIINETGERNMFVSLPGSNLQFFTVSIPRTTQNSVQEEVELALKEKVLFDITQDVVVDFVYLGESETDITIRAVTAPRAWWERFEQVFQSLTIASFHFEQQNQAALMALWSQKKTSPYMYVHVGDDESSFSLVRHDKVVEFGTFPFSNHHFLLEIQKRLTQPGNTAQSYLSTLGIFGADAHEFSMNTIRAFVPVLEHALVSHKPSSAGEYVRHVYIGGSFGGYKGVPELLGKLLRINVESAYPWNHFDARFDDSIFDMKKSETLEYMTALGLALHSVSFLEKK